MPRTLTAPATTEKDRDTGASFVRVLEIQWGGGTGTKYYSTAALSSPVTAEGRVEDWAPLLLQAELGKVGGHGQVELTLGDSDLALKALFDAEPGPHDRPCYIHLWFEGTTWPDDRVTLFGGTLHAAQWSPADTQWRVTLRGFEAFYDRSIGQAITRQAFPEIVCQDCEGAIIPIAYGAPVFRVPACLIDRPGRAALNATLAMYPFDSLFINQSAGDAGFTVDSTITIIVGQAGRWEKMTGSFNTPGDRTRFAIFTRTGILASGTLDGFFGSAGIRYLLIPKADLPDAGAASRGGYPLHLQTESGAWVTIMITYWQIEGSSIVVAEKGGLQVSSSAAYAIGSTPGSSPVWQVGTPIHEVGTWKYAANFLPASSVVRVEGRGRYNLPGGDSRTMFATYDPSRYTATLNDKTHNTALGRDPSDDGITTIALSVPPVEAGFDELTVWVTMHGIGGYSNAADIIEHLLTHDELGGIDSGFIDSTAFAAAKAAIVGFQGFALLESKPLGELTADLAAQAGCLLYWDQGQAVLQKLAAFDAFSAGTSALTIDNSNHAEGSLSIEDGDLKSLTTEVAGAFRMNVPAEQTRLVRQSAGAIGYYGRRRRDLDLWAYQYPSSVALIAELWLLLLLERQRVIDVEAFLHAVHLRPGDLITIDIDAGDGSALLDSVPARVEEVRHTAANPEAGRMETIAVKASTRLFSFSIDVAEVLDNECDSPIVEPVNEYTGGIGDQTIPFTPRRVPTLAGLLSSEAGSSAGTSCDEEFPTLASLWLWQYVSGSPRLIYAQTFGTVYKAQFTTTSGRIFAMQQTRVGVFDLSLNQLAVWLAGDDETCIDMAVSGSHAYVFIQTDGPPSTFIWKRISEAGAVTATGAVSSGVVGVAAPSQSAHWINVANGAVWCFDPVGGVLKKYSTSGTLQATSEFVSGARRNLVENALGGVTLSLSSRLIPFDSSANVACSSPTDEDDGVPVSTPFDGSLHAGNQIVGVWTPSGNLVAADPGAAYSSCPSGADLQDYNLAAGISEVAPRAGLGGSATEFWAAVASAFTFQRRQVSDGSALATHAVDTGTTGCGQAYTVSGTGVQLRALDVQSDLILGGSAQHSLAIGS